MFGKKQDKYIVVDCSFNCTKEKCPKWVVLNHTVALKDGTIKDVPEGRCAIAWLPTLIIELNKAITAGKTLDKSQSEQPEQGK